jgi:hypothetical protein
VIASQHQLLYNLYIIHIFICTHLFVVFLCTSNSLPLLRSSFFSFFPVFTTKQPQVSQVSWPPSPTVIFFIKSFWQPSLYVTSLWSLLWYRYRYAQMHKDRTPAHSFFAPQRKDGNCSTSFCLVMMFILQVLLPELMLSILDALECKRAVKWLCDFIVTQCSRPPPAHSKDLHSSIVAAFQVHGLAL